MSDDTFDARRRVERRLVALDAVAKGSSGPAEPMTLLNLSPLGLRARGNRGLVPGDHVRLELSDQVGAVAKVVWTTGDEFGAVFPTYLPLDTLSSAPRLTAAEVDDGSPQSASEEYCFGIEYGPPGDRRTVYCENPRNALEWHDEIVAAGLPFVRILNADGDVVSADYLQHLLAG